MPGAGPSDIEIGIAGRRGFCLLLDDEAPILSSDDFPRFKNATVEELTTVERPGVSHLYGPLPDIDLAVQSIRNPAEYPLVSKVARPGT